MTPAAPSSTSSCLIGADRLPPPTPSGPPQVDDEDVTDELRRTLQAQGLDDDQKRAEETLEYVDAELARIEQQVEQGQDPEALLATLQHTRTWLAERTPRPETGH
jgi:hypothetical protein